MQFLQLSDVLQNPYVGFPTVTTTMNAIKQRDVTRKVTNILFPTASLVWVFQEISLMENIFQHIVNNSFHLNCEMIVAVTILALLCIKILRCQAVITEDTKILILIFKGSKYS